MRGGRGIFVTLVLTAMLLVGCTKATTSVSFSSTGDGGSTDPETPSTALPASMIGLQSFQIQGITDGSSSSDSQPTISGQLSAAASGGTLNFYYDNGCTDLRGSSSVDGSGAFSSSDIAFKHDGTEDGVRHYYAQLVLGGSASVCVDMGVTYALDTQAPAGPSGFSLVGIASGGFSNERAPTVTVSGMSSENGTTVELFDAPSCSTPIGSGTITSGSVSIQAASYANLTDDGRKLFYARMTDAAGNASQCGSMFLSYILDTTPPADPVPSNWSAYFDNNYGGTVHGDTNPVYNVSGLNAETGGKMLVFSDAACSTQVGMGLIANSSSSSINNIQFLGGGVDDGLKNFYAIIQDRAGNQSNCVSIGGYTLETIPPYFVFDTGSLPATTDGPFMVYGTLSKTLCCQLSSPLAYSSVWTPGPFALQSDAQSYSGNTLVIYAIHVSNARAMLYVQGQRFTIYVIPTAAGAVSLEIPAGLFYDVAGNPNMASGSISVQYAKPVSVGFTQRSSAVSEKAGAVHIGLTASAPVPEDVTVYYKVLPSSTATASHMDLVSGSVIIPSGSATGQISFNVIDSTDSFNRILRVAITKLDSVHPTYFTVAKEPVHSMVIWDDETRVPGFKMISTSDKMVYDYTGQDHTCGIDDNSKVRCWGNNTHGEVGDGTSTFRSTPVLIDSGTDYKFITTDGGATCGITSSDDLKCWGDNTNNRLGFSGTAATPTAVDAGEKYKSVSMGGNASTCAVTLAGEIKCWGDNTSGQLGTGSGSSVPSPVAIDSGTIYTKVSVGSFHSCGLLAGGGVKCWGNNMSYQLGDGTQTSSSGPIVANFTGATDLAVVNYVTCVIGGDQKIYCWGSKNGANGMPSIPWDWYMQSPTLVDGNFTYSRIYGAGTTICGLTTSGMVRCWLAPGFGTSDFRYKATPMAIDDDTYTSFTMSDSSACGQTTSGDWKCWGDLDHSEGLATAPRLADTGVTDNLFLFDNGGCLIPTTGRRRCWGAQEIFYDSGLVNSYARQAPWALDFLKMSGSLGIHCGITASADLYCWDSSDNGLVGLGLSTYSTYTSSVSNLIVWPGWVDPGTKYKEVSVGLESQLCAITTGGILKCWGYNGHGQAGNGNTTTPVRTPSTVILADTFTKVSVGGNFNCAITTSNKLYCWGYNFSGGIGVGNSYSVYPSPVAVDSSSDYLDVKVGYSHACGLLTDHTIKCWGYGYDYQIGIGTNSNVLFPTAVDSSTTYSQLALGSYYSCGLTTAGVVKCWGLRNYTGVGNGSYIQTPTDMDSGTTYQDIQANQDTTCGITTAHELKCWGNNSLMNFGDGVDEVHAEILPF